MQNCEEKKLFHEVEQQLKALARLFVELISCGFHGGLGAGFAGCGKMH
jgi:hypothetical protein